MKLTKIESKLPKLAIKDQFYFRIKEFTILSKTSLMTIGLVSMEIAFVWTEAG